MSTDIFENGIPTPPPKRKEFVDNPVKLCNEISRIFRGKMRELSDTDGVMSQPGARLVLDFLSLDDGVSQSDLVSRTHLKAPTVSVILRKMLEEGMVEIRSDEIDGRVRRVYLTEQGRAVDKAGIKAIKAMDAMAMRGLSEQDCETLMRLLMKIRGNLLSDGVSEKDGDGAR